MNTGAPVDQERRALLKGTRVQEFEILGLIGGGGFGIVYLAHDQSLERRVALKEYMPPLAARSEGTTQVYVNSTRDAATFGTGLKSFVNEARLLARFDHPALVKVHRFWEENGTAYMVMPFYEGPTLQRAVAEKRVPTDETSLRLVLFPLLDALSALHRERCYHRDISPDNILLTAGGPVLLDFGAARMAIGDASQSFTVILKEGYAPVEQYATENATAMRQGPWTDLYALAGVVRYTITGKKPPSAVARMAARTDPLEPLSQVVGGRYSETFLKAIDGAMSLYAEDRPQSIAAFRALLSTPPIELEGITLQRPLPPSENMTLEMPVVVPDSATSGLGPIELPPDRLTLPSITGAQPSGARREHEGGASLSRWLAILVLPLAVVAALAAYRFLPHGLHTVLPARFAAETSAARRVEVSRPVERPERHVARSASHPAETAPEGPGPELPAQGTPDVTAVASQAPLPPEPVPEESGGESARTVALPEAGTASPAVQTEEQPVAAPAVQGDVPAAAAGPAAPAAHERPAVGGLNPALIQMLRAARGHAWGALERRAMQIARTADPVPAGDRTGSRRANEQGLAALRAHHPNEAVAAFKAGVAMDPSDIEVANNHGYALLLAGRRVEAQKALMDVLLRDPTRAVAWTALAEARSEATQDALASLEIALHFASSRERTLARYKEMAQSHPDLRVRALVATMLAQKDHVPTVPEGLP